MMILEDSGVEVGMETADLIERLQGYPPFEGVPEAELLWVVTQGHWRSFEVGEVLTSVGGLVEGAHFLLAGHVALYVERGRQRRKAIEWRGGDVFGTLPYSRMQVSPGEATFVSPSEVVTIERERFPEMIRNCHHLTAALVHIMLDRARLFNSAELRDEKMLSLGKLAAGLAHELNNPASAIVRSAHDLAGRLVEVDERARAFGAAGLGAGQIAAVNAVRDSCLVTRLTSIRSPIEQADREDEIADWLDDHDVDAELAPALAETPITLERLAELAETLSGRQLKVVLHWLAQSCSARGLALEIGEAAGRIHALVGAIKGFTDMDRARISQPVDVAEGLSSTLVMLESRARERGASVKLELAPELPRAQGFAGELNQVWMNLIDNALDAIADGGRVEVGAGVEGGRLVVRIRDDGPGIPEDVLPHIFDPFFTTKGVGEGTGLGLDIVRRLIQGHDGGIEVESRAGRTEFRVTLPLAESPGERGS